MSKKYVIELKPEFEDSFKGLMILGAKDSDLFVDTLAAENLEELNSDYVNEHFGDLQDEAYQRGLEDAWEAAKKLSWTKKYGGYGECLAKVFDRTDTFDFLEYSPNEAIEKLKAYEEHKDNSIKVGDEVIHDDGCRYVVTGITESRSAYGFNKEGMWVVRVVSNLRKTGRHFDIDKILEEMQQC